MWCKLTLEKSTKFLCCLYLTPNNPPYVILSLHLSVTLNLLQTNHLNPVVSFSGDSNIHNANRLRSYRTDNAGLKTKNFAMSRNMPQLAEDSTRISDNPIQQANILDLFLTIHPTQYQLSISSPLGKSDHKLISATSQQPIPP
ncbi:hypothetical protein JTB14_019541 [Gonioctena quinquepunctata]|nr:hypothetical protein JTB14_019541 [Gonioctena quinquepunctata]